MTDNYFIQVVFWNPVNHSYDWVILGSDGNECMGEESARLFPCYADAEKWTQSTEAKKWLPCSFRIKKSVC